MSEQTGSEIREELRLIKVELHATREVQKETNRKLDQLLIGRDGTDGLLPRMTRFETRLNNVVYVVGWILGSIVVFVIAVVSQLVSGWFKTN